MGFLSELLKNTIKTDKNTQISRNNTVDPAASAKSNNIPKFSPQRRITKKIKEELTEDELKFYSALISELNKKNIPGKLTFDRMSDKTLNFAIEPIGQIGRVKIQGRKTRMQFISAVKGSYEIEVEWLENLTLDEMIDGIQRWIEYIPDAIEQDETFIKSI